MTKLQIYTKLTKGEQLTPEEISFLGETLLYQDELLSKALTALEVARSGTEYHEGRNAVYTIVETKDEIRNYIEPDNGIPTYSSNVPSSAVPFQ